VTPLDRRKLGSLLVSPLSLGAMTFGGGFSRDTRVDEDLASALVHTALDAGINLIDTGETYGGGRSEEVLGRVLRSLRGRRDEVVLATKVGFGDLGAGALGYDNVIRACEGSLRRLGIEHIDLYQLHRADRTVPVEETLAALEELVSRGWIREFGVSNYRAWEIARANARQRALDRRTFCAFQASYSLVTRDIEHEILPYCRADEIGVLVYSPLAGGLLAGWRETASAPGRRKSGALPSVPADMLHAARTTLDGIAAARGMSMAQVALAWLLARPGITSVIVGPSKVAQLQDNLAASSLVLTADELIALNSATAPAPIYPAMLDRAYGFPEP
jgi:aryl-alcohol dehydrogenase-like predicted oxidoreductase